MSILRKVEYECPICGEKFDYVTQISYSIFGRNLDFKPFGAVCIPTPVPKCPKCNFVFFEKLFSEEEINRINEKLQANNIFELEPDMPNYYYLAKEYELLDKKIDEIIYYYHSAIWENDDEKLFDKIANIVMAYFEKIHNTNENYYIYKLIEIDFLRRLKKFKMATDLIELLKIDSNFPKNNFDKILNYQLELIEKNDINEHEMPK
jgi:hypothetical protein